MTDSLPPLPQHPRRPGRVGKQQSVEITVYRPSGDTRAQSRMVDFSPTGVGLLHPSPLNIGEQFSISILQPGKNRTKFLYNVVYCNEDKKARAFHIGGEFVCAVSVAA